MVEIICKGEKIMKINNQYTSYRDAYQAQSSTEAATKEKTTQKKESVEVNLSNTSKQIRLSDEVEDMDYSQKIADIKKAINEGTYKVSASEIADKMFDQIKG